MFKVYIISWPINAKKKKNTDTFGVESDVQYKALSRGKVQC